MNPPYTATTEPAADPRNRIVIPGLDPTTRSHVRFIADHADFTATYEPYRPSRYLQWGKRFLDLLIAVPLMLVIAPVLALAAGVVLVSLGRPIIYKQRRVGRGGHPFEIIKLRTMKPETRIDLIDEEPVLELVDRTTAATRILRKLSLDEFCQLWNVIRGEMSLVGPRPEVWTKAVGHGLVAHPRNQVRPGMTGAWQITPARVGDIRDGIQHDLDYIESISLSGDLGILARTPAAIVRSDTN